MEHRLETLEPRVLLAAYTFESWAAALDIPGVLYDVAPPEGVEAAGFGFAAAGLGDLDGDGVGDFAVGAPGAAAAGESPEVPGRVFVYSGATGSLIRTLADGFAGFGRSLASVGDVDGDGVGDLLVGSPRHDGDALDAQPGAGAALVYSGADGSLQRLFVGQTPGGEFGHVVALLGDVNGDTLVEVLVGAPGGGPDGQGQVFIITTALSLVPMPGSEILRVFTGEAAGDRFGEAAIAVPSSGVPHVFIGAPGSDGAGADAGRAYVYAATDGALLATATGAAAGDRFGTALGEGIGFIGEEPVTVLLVGAPGHDFVFAPEFEPQVDSGRVYRLNGLGEIFEPAGPIWGPAGSRMGEMIIPVGDIDGNGTGDHAFILPGAPADQRVQINTIAGAGGVGGTAIFPSAIPLALRGVVFGIGDIDGDGVDDVLGSSPGAEAAVAVSSFALSARESIFGGSGDGSFLFYSAAGSINYAFINGVYTPQGEIPGVLAGDVISLVNNARTIVGRVVVRMDQGFLVEATPFIVSGGVRTLLPDAVVEVVGGTTPAWERMQPVAINEDGAIIFNERMDPTAAPGSLDRAWLLEGGSLTFLWTGAASDINDAGAVVGREVTASTSAIVLRSPGGEITEVAGLVTGTLPRLDAVGRVYGVAPGLSLARWEAGMVAVLATADPSPPGGSPPFWMIFDVSDDGRVLALLTRTVGRGTSRVEYIYTPEDGLKVTSDLVFGTGGRMIATGSLIRFADDGRVLLSNGSLTPVEETLVWSLREGSPLSAAGDAVLGVSTLGDPIFLVRSGETWIGRRVPTGFGSEPFSDGFTITGVTLMQEPGSGRYFAAVLAEGRTYFSVFSEAGSSFGQFLPANDADATPIVANAMTFTTADGRLVLAGTDPAGDLVIYFQNTAPPQVPGFPGGSSPWIYDNLTRTHLDARGQAFVPVASNLTGFSTPWGTDHIAYLDAAGQVHIVWWAPDEPLWRTNQLTTAAGSGALSGSISSFVMPWRTLHLNAFDSEGEVVAVWWAPEFGGEWRTDRLAPGAAVLDPATVSAFLTPWNAMNIVGLDAQTGEVTVYWWAPATNEWRLEPIVFGGGPEVFALTGELASAIGSSQSQNLFGRQDDGHVARLFWVPGDGAEWRYEDLTTLVASA